VSGVNTHDLIFNTQNLKVLSEFFASSWYIFVPFSVFVLLFPNLVEVITLIAVGLIVGYGYISPSVLSFLERYLPQFSNSLESNFQIYSLIVSVVFAVIFYSLYKSLIFVGSFIISFLGGNFLLKSFLTSYLTFQWYIYLVFGLLVGLIGGFYAVKNSSKFIGLIATAMSSFILVSIGMFFFDKYVFNLNNTLFAWATFVLSLLLFFFRIAKLWGVKSNGKN
jgi:hypothetical protein